MHEPIRQSVAVNASPERVYAALTNSGEFTKMSDDTAAEIGTEARYVSRTLRQLGCCI